ESADEEFRRMLSREKIRSIVSLVPAAWLSGEPDLDSPGRYREVYEQYLWSRVASSETFVKEALYARKALV
ncbi:MAG TPA: aminotransferase class I and II, partial [Anseongella sp.]|nr:aminotransferase class I and II [Anseongella sp.]